ncbi:MAG: UDP-N-acetylmuramoyl-L-alanyl-D-glutamate--2,6-diaminopimelate ligase [Spirochaetaceae bacterium]|nr:UDP-N-acetylmuramoyl-L-alanyl-D-glutamate--2,6-diaminopimelate ligase [Spirochaetaceae bacterium]MCF7950887.1 UDP-N-acetylmuramoyl-L-alanyl-D-glutamate--2,6-diaminopimelate ligase [Spirochaetaceae bacterium]
MTGKRLTALLAKINIIEQYGPSDPPITDLAYDSREVHQGSLFFALKGLHSNGHDYVEKAIAQGAAAVVHSDPLPHYAQGVTYLRVENSRRAMSPIACSFYNDPSSEMTIIGVTGTDGKSTTSYFIQQLLKLSGKTAGLLTTVQFDLGQGAEKNYLRQSTPEATEVHRLLRAMRENGCTHAVVEATSHGLSPLNNRLGDVKFDVGVLTNISHEHLEFHKTLERYIDDKANLFRALPPERGIAVINAEEPHRQAFIDAAACPVYLYGISPGTQQPLVTADLSASEIEESPAGQSFLVGFKANTIKEQPAGKPLKTRVNLPQPGRFNVENSLAALLAVGHLPGESLQTYFPLIADLKPVKGRMVPVDEGQPFQVIVDYAHTPGSFRKLFPALRAQVDSGKLIAVFSSAGERDIEKRSQLGEIAAAYCDIIVLADEDPRGEVPLDILEDVAAGCGLMEREHELFLIEDRPTAIRHAFTLATKGDLVVLLGKGHEGSIIYADGPIPWDEETVAREQLQQLGYKPLN